MSILRKFEKTLQERLRGVFAAPEDGGREAIELYRDAIDQIASRATVSSFNRVRVELRAESGERRALLEALFEPGQMREDIRAALLEVKTSAPGDLSVDVTYPEDAATELRVFCEKATGRPAAVATAQPMRIAGTDLRGTVVNVGRAADVLDATGRPIRRNQLCLADEPTVSRAHAHFRLTDGEWRLFDDGSSTGTSVFRDGVRIDVPAHASRGVTIRVGDEIYFGSYCARVEAAIEAL